MKRRLKTVLFLLLLLSSPQPLRSQDIPWEFEAPSRIVAIGDVHGAYGTFVEALRATGLVDAKLNWAGGAAHLVQTGDVLDRGPESRKAMDLLMALEPQAEAAGGRVHALIGNHEFWNAVGDLRYVSREELAAFAGDRDEELRKQSGNQAPEGELALREAYGPNGDYGRWIRGNNAAVKIGDLIFVHGGITPESVSLGLAELNRRVRADMDSESWASSFALADSGPLMTRRYSGDDLTPEEKKSLAPELARVLETLGARSMVMSHTTTLGLIEPRFDGRAVLIDTGMLDVYLGGRMAALVIEEGSFLGVYEKGTVPLPVTLEGEEGARYVEAVSKASPGDQALQHWLALVRYGQGNYREAAKLHEEAGVFDSRKPIPYVWRLDAGDCFAALGEKDKSAQLYAFYFEELARVAEAMGPAGAPYWNRYARESLRVGFPIDSAADAAAKAALADPRNRAFKSTLARVYLEKGEPRRALTVLTAAARLGGEETFEEFFLLGRAHAALGNREQALASFRNAQRLEPENREAEEAIAKLNAETK
jgi:tetratricopeptide (TPR) repeat protein